MRMFKITMSSRDHFYLSEEKLEKLFESTEQLVRILDDKGKLKSVINKAHIINCSFDVERTNDLRRDEQYKNLRIEEPPKKIIDVSKYKPNFLKPPIKTNP